MVRVTRNSQVLQYMSQVLQYMIMISCMVKRDHDIYDHDIVYGERIFEYIYTYIYVYSARTARSLQGTRQLQGTRYETGRDGTKQFAKLLERSL